MATNKKSNDGILEKLAVIADQAQSLYKGKATIVFELEKEEYSKTISMFRDIDKNHKQFKIDISGTDLIFILDENE
jgi:hypothetical protein